MKIFIPIRYTLLCALIILTIGSSCSIRQYQAQGDLFYIGIKDIKVEGERKTKLAEQALLAAEAQLAYAPNNSIFGSSTMRWPIPLWRPWLYAKYAGSTSWLEKRLHRLGAKPIWIRDVSPMLRAKVAERVLSEYGYLGAQVESEVLKVGKDSLDAKVNYTIKLGELYHLDSVAYLSPFPLNDTTQLAHAEVSELKVGEPYTVEGLINDRNKLTKTLREHGYYFFNSTHVTYEADTINRPGAVLLRTQLASGLADEVLRQWRIRSVRVRFLDGDDLGQTLSTDTLRLNNGVTAYFSGKIPIRPKVLDKRLRLRPDSIYRYSNEDLTLKSLSSIGTFVGTELLYQPVSSADSLADGGEWLMDMTLLMRRDKPWDATFGGRFMLKSTDFMGPGLTLGLNRRNLFGGGETFSINASGSYEWQSGKNPLSDYSVSLNSYQLMLDAGLTFPTLLIPGRFDAYYAFPTTTTFKLAAQRLNRAGYYGLNTFTLSATYDFSPFEGHTHSITPLSISYSQLGNTTTAFDQILSANPSLELSLSSQFIPQIGYAYTWEKKVGKAHEHSLWLRGTVSEAGNIIKLATLLGGNSYSDRWKILNVPFAQFVKATGEVRYQHRIDRNNRIATRLGIGAIYSYGNMTRAPYVEQFYVGGANSIRAFTVRSLGPGSFTERGSSAYTFMDHVGEAKLEMNMEYRMKLTGSLEGALFVDAGNVWLLRKDMDRLGGSLSEVQSIGQFLDQIAVGTGLGFRYDMSYLVVRFDVGVGLHLPYKTSRSGWYNIPRFPDALGIHLAIGYPF